jgi:hypothetical protein
VSEYVEGLVDLVFVWVVFEAKHAVRLRERVKTTREGELQESTGWTGVFVKDLSLAG